MKNQQRWIVCVALVLMLGGLAWASTVTSTSTVNGANTTYTFVVNATGTESITDFHILGPTDKNKVTGTTGNPTTPPPPTAPPGTPPVPLAGWTGSRGGGSANWKAGTPATPITAATGPVTFTITIPTNQLHDGLVRWRTTNGLDVTVDSGPDAGEPSTHGPIANVTVTPGSAPIGTATIISLDSTEPLRPYKLYAVSSESDGAPDPWDDNAAFVSWVNAHPVPSGWGLSFQNTTGTVDANGDSNQPRVVIPNTPGLVGNRFYLIAVVDSQTDDLGVSYKIRSADREVTITAP